MKKDYFKYGILFLLGWNAFLWLCVHIKYLLFDSDIYHVLWGSPYDFWLSTGLILLLSIIWYAIGHYVRKEYVTKRQQFRANYWHLSQSLVDQYYWYSYVAKYTGILYKAVLISIPIYALLRRDFLDGDFLVLTALGIIAGLLFYIHRKNLKKSRI